MVACHLDRQLTDHDCCAHVKSLASDICVGGLRVLSVLEPAKAYRTDGVWTHIGEPCMLNVAGL